MLRHLKSTFYWSLKINILKYWLTLKKEAYQTMALKKVSELAKSLVGHYK